MKDFLKQYLPYYKNYKRRIIVSIIAIILVAGSSAAIAYMMKPLLDEIFIEKNTTMLYYLPIVIIVAYLIKGGGSYIQAYYMSFVGQDIVKEIRNKMMRHTLSLDLSFFHKYHSGEILSRITNDVNRIQAAVSTSLATLIREILTAVALIGVVIYQSPFLALFTFVVIPASYYPITIIAKKLKKISHSSQEKNADLTKGLNETLANIEIIKAYGTEDYETKKFAKNNQSFFDINIKSVRTSELMVPIMELFAAFSAAAVIIVGGKEVIDGNMSVGSFFSFLTAMFMAVDPIRRISVTYASFQDAIAANDRINYILSLNPEVKSGNKHLTNINSLEFENVNLQYKDSQDLSLKNIDLTVNKGDIFALVGSSGSGKSSIINLMLRFFDASDGQVKLNNENIQEYLLDDVRKKISIVTQRIYIFNDTISANVAYGEEIEEQKVIEALKKANIYDHIEKLPEGIHTLLNESGTNLSGGQRQRIAIARALYKNPDILIFDEATSALDNTSEEEITKTIKDISKDLIVIIVAHRKKSFEIAHKVCLLQEGEIKALDSLTELENSNSYFQELYK